MSDYLDPNNEELLKDFFAEAYQQVDTIEQNLLVLENDPSNRDAIDEIFRAAHTLKGGAATVQMDELAEFTHVVEDVLDDVRSGKVEINSERVDLLLSALDIIKSMLSSREQGDVYSEDISSVVDALKAMKGEPAEEKQEGKKKKKEDKKNTEDKEEQVTGLAVTEEELRELLDAVPRSNNLYKVDISFDPDNVMNSVGGIQGFAMLKALGSVLKTEPEFEKLYEDEFFPVVTYYVSSPLSVEEFKGKAVLPSDVALSIDVVKVSADALKASSSKEKQTSDTSNKEKTESAEKEVYSKTEQEPEEKETEETIESINNQIAKTVERKQTPTKKSAAVESILRVDSRRIDALLNLVSESVINKATFNQISVQFSESFTQFQTLQSLMTDKLRTFIDDVIEISRSPDVISMSDKQLKRMLSEKYAELFTMFDPVESEFKDILSKYRETTQQLNRITGEMQEAVMRIRMVPISQIFSRFPRLVRDLSRSLEKNINLIIEGQDTELDKSVIEDLLDPLIHCVRNSVDHGIETPTERKKIGKSPEGTIVLRAKNEGNLIVIEIIDDGKGIDVDAVRKRAIDRGLIHPNKVLSQVEAFNLIFEPGFSTAKKVTNVSGRGVGLDVVKKQIEKLNGSISVWSEKGAGTHFTIKLPLTLAIIQGLMVEVGKERYAIPVTSVIDCHRIKPDEIRFIDGYEVFDVRDDVVSLLRLNRLFKIDTDEQRDYLFVVIVGNEDKKMGIIVDSIIGEEDVVIKPLKDHFVNSPGIAGANITGEGTVSLIIDVPQLLELGLKREREARKKRETSII
ncbi:chemotaxis protein CheA [Spirochaetia bacterium 38H-sp]|uniref:Chemotaxis protein CheA n=1 Tax=Rarispira pelagica TaxID=3141764 RepID=A0ABU9UCN2_9SPIR